MQLVQLPLSPAIVPIWGPGLSEDLQMTQLCLPPTMNHLMQLCLSTTPNQLVQLGPFQRLQELMQPRVTTDHGRPWCEATD